jgi:23S rRNA (adenine2503-C2)-methyltransferase
MVDQILSVEHMTQKPLDSILLMGMGEPLANYENLVSFLQMVRHPQALGFGARHVTVSTSGLVPQIEALAEVDLRVNLAISLHSAYDSVRATLLPKASRWSVKEVLKSAKLYSKKTGARVTFEIVLIAGVNDLDTHAKRLANLLRGPSGRWDCWVNLIAYNPVPGLSFRAPSEERIESFKKILIERGVPVRLRKPQGIDIGSGCGQLGEGI